MSITTVTMGESTNVKTGLQYLRARYYNAENGTFTTEDSDLGTTENPLPETATIMRPIIRLNYSDPTGHSLWSRIKVQLKKQRNRSRVSARKSLILRKR